MTGSQSLLTLRRQDTDMLIDHGMRQHYITHSAQLAQFSKCNLPSSLAEYRSWRRVHLIQMRANVDRGT